MIVTITLNPSIDRTYDVGALRPGSLHRAAEVWNEASGKGVNVTRLLHQLRTPSAAIVTLGGPDAAVFRELAADIRLRVVPVRGAVRSNITLLTGADEPTKVNAPGGRLDDTERARLLDEVTAAVDAGAERLVLSGSLPGDTPATVVSDLIRVAHRRGVPVTADTTGAALRAAVDSGADLLAPNAAELSELTGMPVSDPLEAIAAGRAVRARRDADLLISLGPDGAVWLTADNAWHAVPPVIRPVNTTGAGDALLAGFLAAGDRAHDDRMAFAISVAGSVCLVADSARLPDDRIDPSEVTVHKVPLDPPYVPSSLGEA